MTEELALHQRLGQGAAVYGDERALRTLAALVDGARNDFFAGAALAGDEHARATTGHAPHEVHHGLHLLALADEAAHAEAAGDLGSELAVLVNDGALLEGLFDLRQKLAVLERLLDVVVGAETHGFDGLLRGREGRNHDDLQRVIPLPHGLEDLHAGPIGHGEIGDYEIEGRFGLKTSQGAAAALEELHLVSGSPQEHSKHLAQTGFVVCDKDACWHQAKPAFWGALGFGGLMETA